MKKISLSMAILMIFSAVPMMSATASAQAGAVVAETGGVQYQTLASAFSAAQSGAEIKLLADTNEKITLSDGKKLTLSGGEHVFSGSFTVSGSGTALTLADGKYIRTLDDGIPLVTVSDGATVGIYGGIYSNTNHRIVTGGSGSGVTVNVYGGSFLVSSTGAVIRVDNGKTNVWGGVFCNQQATNSWGIVNGTLQGGWQYALGAIDNASEIRNEAGMYQLFSAELPTVGTGASVRMVKESTGIRFLSEIPKTTLDYVKNTMKGTDLSYGTLIAPADELEKVPAFTKEFLEKAGVQYVDVVAKDGIVENADGSLTLRAALVNIKETHYAWNFAAVSYVTYRLNGHTVTIYGSHDMERNVRSMQFVAYRALQDVKRTSDERYSNLVADSYTEALSGTVYSPFGTAQRNALYEYAKGYVAKAPKLFGSSFATYTILLSETHTYAEERFAKRLQKMIAAESEFVPGIRVGTPTGADEILISSASSPLTLTVTADGKRNLTFHGDPYAFQSLIEADFEGLMTALTGAENTAATVYTRAVPRNATTETLYRRAEGSDVRVIFQNIWGWDNAGDPNANGKAILREQLLGEAYTQYLPDIICLQECCESTGVGTSAAMRDANKKLHIMNSLPSSYREVTGNKDGKNYSATPILYNSAAVKLVDSGTVKYTGNGAGYDKFFTWAIFQREGAKFGVCSTHLDYRGGDEGIAGRQAQIDLLAAEIKSLSAANGNCPFIVGGDMNASYSGESATLEKWGAYGFTDTHAIAATKDDIVSDSGSYPGYDTVYGLLTHDIYRSGTYQGAIDHVFCYGANTTRPTDTSDAESGTVSAVAAENAMTFLTYDILNDSFLMCGSDHAATLVEFSLGEGTKWTPYY